MISKDNGLIEFALQNEDSSIYKYNVQGESNVILNELKKYVRTVNLTDIIDLIFKNFGEKIKRFGIDKKTNRYKFYISLHNESFNDVLRIIIYCRNILGIKEKYYLEKNFVKFIWIGFDVSRNGIMIKIYECVELGDNFDGLPQFIKKEDIDFILYMKTFDGRRKKIFEFKNFQDIGLFKEDFLLLRRDDLQKKVKNYPDLQKKVKYYCIEGEKKEIYFT